MLRRFVLLSLLAGLALAQTAPPAAPQKPAARKTPAAAGTSAAKPATTGPVGPDTPVMFIGGLCSLTGTTVPAALVVKPGTPPCTRAVTRRQLDWMAAGMGPRAQAAGKTQIAAYYANALAIDNAARKLQLDHDPEVLHAIWMGRVSALSEALHRQMQKQFGNIPESDITAYYEKNKPDFEEATVQRVAIPKPSQAAKAATGEPKKEGAPESPSAAKATTPAAVPYEQQVAARKALAEKLLARAQAGEDLNRIQKDAFVLANVPEALSEAESATIHRGQLPATHDEKVFAAQSGQFTPLIEEPSAYYFYKVGSRRTVPLAEVKDAIRRELVSQKEDAEIRKLFGENQPQLNPAYFTPPPKSGGAKPAEEPPEAAPAPQSPETPKPETPSAPPK